MMALDTLLKQINDENAGDTMRSIPLVELRRRQDSLMENIGALRFSIAHIERLEGYRRLFRDLLGDCKKPLKDRGNAALVKRIEDVIDATRTDEDIERSAIESEYRG